MTEWESLALWFDLVKKNVGVDLDDHFKIGKSDIRAKGRLLENAMLKFWQSEGVNHLSNIRSQYDLTSMAKRMRLKSHLINMLHQECL